jgi:hypothetical protein
MIRDRSRFEINKEQLNSLKFDLPNFILLEFVLFLLAEGRVGLD